MDIDVTLEWMLRIRNAMDIALESGEPPDPDAVYALLGLIDAVDGWMRDGRRVPARWQPTVDRALSRWLRALRLDTQPSNDVLPARRRKLVRTRRANASHQTQLALPLGE